MEAPSELRDQLACAAAMAVILLFYRGTRPLSRPAGSLRLLDSPPDLRVGLQELRKRWRGNLPRRWLQPEAPREEQDPMELFALPSPVKPGGLLVWRRE